TAPRVSGPTFHYRERPGRGSSPQACRATPPQRLGRAVSRPRRAQPYKPSWLRQAVRVGSSSRSQLAIRTARAVGCLSWEPPSVGVHWRRLLSLVIVTHLVTRSLTSRCHERPLRRSFYA